ncbi:hypothetical protein CONLIGDRAFT_306334 [Coniochaeta ligniaria NRRL 30616]|uniref:Uncharacterized protein n=1 Tax=Coniochaeta ligniaria NRRL 30616 TaxID=1408157 RepID=A0A1J7JPF0_9PEZI|nr:hypothetical protein CONLIGDRAFT_306334 [Coniochaeta ligniaria NRRL 30616]
MKRRANVAAQCPQQPSKGVPSLGSGRQGLEKPSSSSPANHEKAGGAKIGSAMPLRDTINTPARVSTNGTLVSTLRMLGTCEDMAGNGWSLRESEGDWATVQHPVNNASLCMHLGCPLSPASAPYFCPSSHPILSFPSSPPVTFQHKSNLQLSLFSPRLKASCSTSSTE